MITQSATDRGSSLRQPLEKLPRAHHGHRAERQADEVFVSGDEHIRLSRERKSDERVVAGILAEGLGLRRIHADSTLAAKTLDVALNLVERRVAAELPPGENSLDLAQQTLGYDKLASTLGVGTHAGGWHSLRR
jgi:hypothetical protein